LMIHRTITVKKVNQILKKFQYLVSFFSQSYTTTFIYE
jgi:hypothetical protein